MSYSVILLTAYCLLLTLHEAYAETTNRIIAVVNDEVITEGDLHAYVTAFLRQQDSTPLDEDETQAIRQAVLERLIDERLILHEAKRKDLTVEPDEVAERLDAVQQQFETPEAYAQMLREAGLSEEQLKRKIREQLLVQQAIDQDIRSKIRVSPSEVGDTNTAAGSSTPGEEVRAHHLLVRVTEQRSADEAQGLAHQLYQQLMNGSDFEEVFERSSRVPGVEGKVLGWVGPGQLLPELDRVLFSLKPGELSSPIQTRLGFHLVKVIERRSLSDAELAAAYQQRRQQIYQDKFADAMTTWLRTLREQAYIEILQE